MPIYEYKCPSGHIEEKITQVNTEVIACSDCGEMASRIISRPAQCVVKGLVHTDTNIPMDVHKTLVHKNREDYEHLVKVRGKEIEPEDM